MNDLAKVFVVDDDPSMRDAISTLLDAAGHHVVTFSHAEDFLDICTPNTCGCIILDVNMPDMDGPAMQQELTRRGLQLPIIFLSGKRSIPLTVRAIKSGAMDFLTKPVKGSILLARAQEALERCAVLRNEAKTSQSFVARLATLTQREQEVMMLAVEGLTCKETAQRLGISHRTVEIHRAHVMQKTGASNMLELARIASYQSQNQG
jgi:FixJ family two-component response regulator